MNTQTPFILLL